MYNAYISSSISLRSKGPLSFSFNDYSYDLNERFERTPLSSCCSCCAFRIHSAPISPSLLYGLRQSALIHWSASRRFILGGGDRYYCRVPVYGVDRDCYGVTCCLKEMSVNGRRKRRGKGRFGCMVTEEKRELYHLGGVDDSEVILSLLSEELSDECFGAKERNGVSSKRVQVEKRGNAVNESFRGKKKEVGLNSTDTNKKFESKRVQVDKRGNDTHESFRGKRKEVGLSSTDRNLKSEFELVRIKAKEESCKPDEKNDAFPRGEDRRASRCGSSCSSYYSFSSSGDFESETEVQFKHGGAVGEYSTGFKPDSKRNRDDRFSGEVVEDLERHEDDYEGHGEALEQGNTAVDWRKRSEQMLTEVPLKQTESKKESSQTHCFRRTSISRKQFDDKEEMLTLAENLDEETRKRNSRTGSQVIGQSKSAIKYQQFADSTDIHTSDLETTSTSLMRSNGREENFSGKGGCITGQDKFRRNSQQFPEMLKTQCIDTEGAFNLQRQSAIKMKDQKEKSTFLPSSVQQEKVQHHQTGEWIFGQNESSIESQKFSDISEIHDSDIEKSSTSQRQSEGRVINPLGSFVSLCPEAEDPRQLAGMIKTQDTDAERIPNMQRQSANRMKRREEKPTSVPEAKMQQHETGERFVGKMGSRRKFKEFSDISEFHDSDVGMTSASQRHPERKIKNQEGSSISLRLEAKDSRQPTEVFKAEDINTERAANMQRQSAIKIKDREEKSTSFPSSVQTAKEQRQPEKIVGQADSRRRSQPFSDISEIHGANVEKTSTSQRQSEGKLKNLEGNSDSLRPDAKEHFRKDRKDIWQMESTNGSQDVSSVSVAYDSGAETVTCSQEVAESYLTSSVKPVEETGYQKNQTDDKLVQFGSRKDERDKGSSQAVVKPPATQLVARGSFHVGSSSGFVTQDVSKQTSESGSSSLSSHTDGSSSDLYHALYGGGTRDETYGGPLNLISHEDALGSAGRLEKSSEQFVKEFVEKASHEVSTSKIQMDNKLSKTKLVYEGEKQKRKGFRYGSEGSQSKEHVSVGFGMKGPSDEMWNVADSSVQDHPKADAPKGTTTTENAIVRRTGRSLWCTIADIIRMRWVSHPINHSSAVKSGGRSSSNESASSETWFSGHEPDENNDENVKREKRSRAPESASGDQLQPGETPSQSQRERFDKDKISLVEGDNSSFLTTSQVISSASGYENRGWSESGKSFQGTSSSTAIVESSLPLPSRVLRSPTVDEIEDTDEADVSGSGPVRRMKRPLSVRLTEASGTEENDTKLKQSKLQRNKQVLKDEFEEWEEAYRLESEQRKIDELFMREALLEAKKAADTWEVPVGAVLVHRGKIIARGCNLVEALRDSTAHAEMICIREASNILRSWRLAETTLYVTLEPCPMCAGAILQARVDTLVWGAPNKLLGADGSWIRLFPSDGEEGSASEKPPAPVHPYHPKMTIRRGVLAADCADVMQQFFQLRRKKKESKSNTPSPPSSSCLPISNHPSKLLTKMHDIFHIMFCL